MLRARARAETAGHYRRPVSRARVQLRVRACRRDWREGVRVSIARSAAAQTSREEMSARGRDEQEESVNAAASPAFSITISAQEVVWPRNRLHVRVVGGVVLSRAAALMGTSQS